MSNNSSVGSSSSSNTSSSRHDMQDVNYLLYLETKKRLKANECRIRRQVEEKMQQYFAYKEEYELLYKKLYELYACAAERYAMDLPESPLNLEETQQITESILSKVQNDVVLEVLDEEVVKKCKEFLKNFGDYTYVSELSEKIAEQKECVEDIKSTSQNVANSLTSLTLQTIDLYAEQLNENKNSI